jgi:mannose-6-phosphate isomerase-like protein (cupin superfamily)
MPAAPSDVTQPAVADRCAEAGNDFDPFARGSLIAEVPGMRVLGMSLGESQQVNWHKAPRSTTMIFANVSGIAVEIQRPPFRCVLQAGEFYIVPPGMAMTMYSSDGSPVSFTLFQYGESLFSTQLEPPARRFAYERTAPPALPAQARPEQSQEDLSRYHLGLTRLDVLAAPPNMRLLVQGHGVYECATWHSHDNITDNFFCVQGYALIATKNPDVRRVLAPGEVYMVAAGVLHFVSGAEGKPCVVLVLQGVGVYNSVDYDFK